MKTYPDIIAEVRLLIAETVGKSVDAIDEAHTISEISNDSIQLFELLLAFERRYDVRTSYEDILALNTVGDVAAYVWRMKYAYAS